MTELAAGPRRSARRARLAAPGALLVSGVLALCGVCRSSSLSFLSQRLPQASLSRRQLSLTLGLPVGLGSAGAARAAASGAVNSTELARLTEGYTELTYLLDNWNKVTRKCDKNADRMFQNLASGQESPDNCIAKPDEVRKYLGIRSVKHKLFNTKQLFVDIEICGLVPDDKEDKYSDAVDDFEKYKRQADEWAYSSAWAEYNPGGGRDKTEDYLIRAKKETVMAHQKLGEILRILQLI